MLSDSWLPDAAREVEVVGVEDLEGEEQQHDLEREGAAVDKVAVEEVGAALRRVAKRLEDVEQVVVLAVRVAADVAGGALGDGHVDERRQLLQLRLERD
eukprot:7380451-Prymnesium_polylepis.2